MKKYRVRAEETIYAIYEIEVEAKNEEQAREISLETAYSDYKSSDLSNSEGDFTIEAIEEIE